MARLYEAARDVASDFLAAVGTCLYLLAFFGALHSALARLAYH